MTKYKLIDASNQILGRLCSNIAKGALLGENYIVINCSNVIISGTRNDVFGKYLHRNQVKNFANPRRGPFYAHRPDTLVRWTVKAMLPKNKRGAIALDRIKFFIDEIPKRMEKKFEIEGESEFEKTSAAKLRCKFVTVEEVCKRNGWSGKLTGES